MSYYVTLSEIKLKRTDTTLDLSQKAKRAKEEKKRKGPKSRREGQSYILFRSTLRGRWGTAESVLLSIVGQRCGRSKRCQTVPPDFFDWLERPIVHFSGYAPTDFQ